MSRPALSKEDLTASLFIAVEQGQASMARELVQAGASLHQKKDNKTSVSLAIEKEHWSVVEAMAEAASPADKEDLHTSFSAAVWTALEKQQFSVVEHLLQEGVWLGNMDVGTNHLHVALDAGAPSKLMGSLIERGASLIGKKKYKKNASDTEFREETPAAYAASNNYWDGLRAIYTHAESQVSDNRTQFGWALLFAFDACQFDIARLLLQSDIDCNSLFSGTLNRTLHVAINRGAPVDLIYLLLRRGADPQLKNSKGETPLQRAVSLNRGLVVTCFLKTDAPHAPFKEFLVLWHLRRGPLSQFPFDVMNTIAEFCQYGYIDKLSDLNQSVLQDIRAAKQAILKNKKVVTLSPLHHFYLQEALTDEEKIERINNKVMACKTDREKSVYVHQLLDQYAAKQVALEAALLLLNNMQQLFPKIDGKLSVFKTAFGGSKGRIAYREQMMGALFDTLTQAKNPSPIACYLRGLKLGIEGKKYLTVAKAANRALRVSQLSTEQLTTLDKALQSAPAPVDPEQGWTEIHTDAGSGESSEHPSLSS